MKNYLRVTSIFVCFALIVPTLHSAENKAKNVMAVNSAKNALVVLSKLFPATSIFIDSILNIPQISKEYSKNENVMSMKIIPAVEASSNTPKTKD